MGSICPIVCIHRSDKSLLRRLVATRTVLEINAKRRPSIMAFAAGFAPPNHIHGDGRRSRVHGKYAWVAGVAAIANTVHPMWEHRGLETTASDRLARSFENNIARGRYPALDGREQH